MKQRLHFHICCSIWFCIYSAGIIYCKNKKDNLNIRYQICFNKKHWHCNVQWKIAHQVAVACCGLNSQNEMKWQNCLVTILTFLQGVELSSAGSRAGEWGELGSGSDKFNDDLRFTTALAWFSCVTQIRIEKIFWFIPSCIATNGNVFSWKK